MTQKKKLTLLAIVIVIIMWIVVPALYIEHANQPDPYIGKMVVIKKDTLIVMGYDSRTQNYILDDGRQIGERMVELFKIEEYE